MFWQLIFLAAFVFIITYDPKSGTLNHLVDSNNNNPLKMRSVKRDITRRFNLLNKDTSVLKKSVFIWVRLYEVKNMIDTFSIICLRSIEKPV
jgi:hypothetical protein